jgi:hypothetical protein
MKNDLSNIPCDLQQISIKLTALAHLIEQMGISDNPLENPEDVFYGIGLLLQENAKNLKSIANKIEGTSDTSE